MSEKNIQKQILENNHNRIEINDLKKEDVVNVIQKNIHKMDAHNATAANLLSQGNIYKSVEHMFTDGTGKKLSYAEMRYLYG